MGPSGGDMAMIGDLSEKLSINYSDIPKSISNSLKKVNHEGVIISNPFDLQTYNWNDPKSLRKTFDLMFKANFDLIALMLDFPNMKDCDVEEWEAIVDQFILSNKSKKTKAALIASLPETLPKHIRDKCFRSGIVPLQGLQEALFAINSSIVVKKAWTKSYSLKKIKYKKSNKKNIKTYTEFQSKKILHKYGIKIPNSILSNRNKAIKDSKQIGFPLVLKINSKKIIHKTELKGVFTNVESETEVKKNINHLSKLGNSFLIEKMIKNKVAEIIIGIKVDDQFGPLIVIGSGGIYTELINDSVTLLLPLKKQIVLDAINNLRISKLLYGYRGKEEGDINALVETVLKLGKFVEKNASNLVEADINPLIICNKGKGVIAADALIHYLEEIK
tara:strand:+ start:1 stop:1167 length:1167 start_codon:yes stop_codon:yes gene_type:complete